MVKRNIIPLFQLTSASQVTAAVRGRGDNVFARRVHMRLKSNCIVQLTEKFDTEIIPMLRKVKGFQDEITFVTQSGSEAFAISLWDRAESAEVYNHTIYPAIVKIVSKF